MDQKVAEEDSSAQADPDKQQKMLEAFDHLHQVVPIGGAGHHQVPPARASSTSKPHRRGHAPVPGLPRTM